jgi:hypothetical protein
VGLDLGYREHVAVASPLSVFNVRRNPDEVQQLLTSLGVPEAGLSVAEVVHKRTAGNPLFAARRRLTTLMPD